MIKDLYERHLLPRLTNWVCGAENIERQRRKVVPHAQGHVLEIGIGSGLNLPHYAADRVESVVGVDPTPEMTAHVAEQARQVPFEVSVVNESAERLPFAAERFDSVVVTYTLCTIPDPERALREMHRVLRPGGRLLFVEHGLAPDRDVQRWQHRLNPVWKRLGGGCNLDRDVPRLLRDAGFELGELETMYLPGFRWLNFNYWGAAQLRVPRDGTDRTHRR